MLDFRDKKEARTMGPLRKNKKSPINSKVEGKERVAGGDKGAGKGAKSIRRRHEKKCPREVFSLLLGHSAFVK